MRRYQFVLRLAILFVHFLLFVNAFSVGPVWLQTDWSGGSGQDSLVDSTMYQLDDGLMSIANPPGEISIEYKVEKGDGSDGDIIISTVDSVVNIYTDITTGTFTSGSTQFTVSSTAGFANGDEILLIQMQHSSNAGTYEFATINNILSATSLELENGITNSYFSGLPDQANASITQIVRVPNFNSVQINDNSSITSKAWNGTTGGIVVIRSKNHISFGLNAKIHTDTMGFRGGAVGYGNNEPGTEGEGILGKELALGKTSSPYVTYPTGINNGGAPGSGVSHAGGGGGGGGHATSGTIGQPNTATYNADSAYGGNAVGTIGMTKVFLGGGGGGGGDDDSQHNGVTYPIGGADGGNGGGIIFVFADSINGGEFSSNGESKPDTEGGSNPAGAAEGSGGAGGSLILYSRVFNTVSMSVDGGEGSNLKPGESGYNSSYGYGGDGSQGRIRVGYANLISTVLGADVGSSEILTYYDTTEIISSISNYNDQQNVNGPYSVSWNATLNSGTAEVFLRTGNSSATVQGASWESVTNGSRVVPSGGISYGESFFQYRVLLKPNGGNTATPSFEDISIELNVAPNSVSLSTPLSGTEQTITPILDWTDVTDDNTNDTVSYILEIDNTADFSSPVLRTSSLSTSVYSVDSTDGLFGHMTYFWRVWSKDLYPDSSISTDTFSFTTENNAPGTFSLLSPLNGTENSITPTFLWNKSSDIDPLDTSLTYIVEVDDNSNFSSILFRSNVLNDTSYQVTVSDSLKGHKTYYWRVWAKDSYPDSTLCSDTLSFSTANNPPDQFDLLTPAKGTENSVLPLLSWRKPNDIDPLDTSFEFHVELDDNADFSSPLFRTSVLTDTTYQVVAGDSLKGHMTYYWRVWAKDSYPDSTLSSDIFFLTTEDNPPNTFTLLSPNTASEVSLTPLFRWSKTSDVDPLDNSFLYVVEVDNNSDFSSPEIRTTDLNDTSYQVLVGDNLLENTEYYWRVWAKDSYPDSTISSDTFVIFTDVTNDIPSLSTPLNPIPNTERGYYDTLSWTRNDIDPGDTLRYNIRLGGDILFNSYIASKNNWLGERISISDLDGSNLLEDNKIYYWQVEAHDPDGASSGYTSGTDSIFFNKINNSPSIPQNLDPSNETAVNGDNYLTWDIYDADSLGLTPDVLTYSIVVDNNSDFSSPLGTTTGISVDSIKISDLTNSSSLFDNVQYFWKVLGTDNHGLSGSQSDGLANFWFNNSNGAPSVPSSLLPIASSLINPTDSLTWSASVDNDPYDQINYVVEISLQGTFTTVITRDTTNLTGIKINEIRNYSVIQSGSTLYWRVKAFDSQGAESSWAGGATQTILFVSTAPSVPALLNPLSGATYFPTEEINWSSSIDNDAGVYDSILYILQLSSAETFSVIMESDTGSTVSRTLEQLNNYASFIDNSSYYWRVNAIDNHGVFSGWSDVESFVLDKSNNTPTVPIIIQPKDTFVMFNDSLFVWNKSTDPDPDNIIDYKILAAKDSSFLDTVLFVENISDSNVTLEILNLNNQFNPIDYMIMDTLGFLDDRFYYWKIAAVDNRNASSAYTTPQYFYVNIVDDTPGVAYSLTPDFNAITFPTEQLSWSLDVKYEFGDTTKFVIETSLDSFTTIYGIDTIIEDTSVQLNSLLKIDSLPDESKLYWRIKTIDIGGNSKDYSKVASLFYSVSNTAPTQVTGLSPNDSIQPLKPTEVVTWNASADLEKDSIFYDIYFSETLIDTSSDDSLFIAKEKNYYGNSLVMNTIYDGYNKLIHNKVYFWRARAIDEHDFRSQWTLGGLFRFTGTAPSTPTNLVPSDSTELTVGGELTWSKCVDSDPGPLDTLRYVVNVFSDAAQSLVISTDTIILDTSIILKNINGINLLNDDNYYYWTVKSMDVHGTSSPTPVYGAFYFNRSNSAPNAPDSLLPLDLIYRRPFQKLSWFGSDPDQGDTLAYRIELSTDTVFTVPLRVINNWKNLSLSIDTFANYKEVLVHDSVYYWRVRATDQEGEISDWSEIKSFIYDEKDDIATAPEIITPTYNEYVIGLSQILWKNSTDEDDSLITYHVDVSADSTFASVDASLDSITEGVDSNTSILFLQLSGIEKIIENKEYFLRIYPKSKVDSIWVPGNTSDIQKIMFGNNKVFDTTGLSQITVINQKATNQLTNIAISVDSMVNIIFPDSSVSGPTLVKITTVPVLGTIISPDSVQLNTSDSEIKRLKSIVLDANKYVEGDRRTYYIKERAYIIDLLNANNPDSTVSLLDSVLLQIDYHDTNSNSFVDGDERIPISALSLFRLNESTNRWEEVVNSYSTDVSEEGAEILNRRDLSQREKAVGATTNHFSVYTILAKRDLTEPFGDFKVYPSPFKAVNNSTATISYKLTQNAEVEIRIYSRTGGLVWSKEYKSGEEPGGVGSPGSPAKLIPWNGRNNIGRRVGNGAYIVKIKVKPDNGKLVTKKQLLGVVK